MSRMRENSGLVDAGSAGTLNTLNLGTNIANIMEAVSLLVDSREEKTVHWFLSSSYFCIPMSCLVIGNIATMGLQADHPDWALAWTITENGFTAAFLLEMFIKLYLLRLKYFRDKCNWIDGCLVALSIADNWVIKPIGGEVNIHSLSVLRVLRVFRVVRIIRVFRYAARLVLILSGVVDAMRSTCWVAGLLLLGIFVCAIFCTEYIGHVDSDMYPGYTDDMTEIWNGPVFSEFNPYSNFGSMGRSMLTLFNMVILAEWSEIVRPVAGKQPYMVPFFLVFVLCATFGLMNVIIGMIVDSVMKNATRMIVENAELERARKLEIIKDIQSLVSSIDRDDDGKLSVQELTKSLRQGRMRCLLNQVNVPRDITGRELMNMLDCNGDGHVTGDEFVGTFYRLVECDDFQRSCLVQMHLNALKGMMAQQLKVAGSTRRAVDRLHAEVQHVKRQVLQQSTDVGPDWADSAILSDACEQRTSNFHSHASTDRAGRTSGVCTFYVGGLLEESPSGSLDGRSRDAQADRAETGCQDLPVEATRTTSDQRRLHFGSNGVPGEGWPEVRRKIRQRVSEILKDSLDSVLMALEKEHQLPCESLDGHEKNATWNGTVRANRNTKNSSSSPRGRSTCCATSASKAHICLPTSL